MKITLLTGKTFDISSEIGMNIKVISSRSRGKLVLHIDAKERIPVLSVPKYCSRKRAIKFVNENIDWIEENLRKLPSIKKFMPQDIISICGKQVTICHCPNARRGVWIEENILNVSGNIEFLHRRVKDYIKKQAQQNFLLRSKHLAEQLNCHINNVIIKDTKSRWGSCSVLSNINYNWRIALAPEYVIDYLMAHEVAHLRHPDHSDEFWHCVAMLNPQWKKGKIWLQEHGKNLYAYP